MEESDDFDFNLYPPLKDCIDACEVVCNRGCCGFDAFFPDPAAISAWAARVDRNTVELALKQLEALIDEVNVVRNPFHNVIPSTLNSISVNAEDQKSFKDFLSQIQSALLQNLKAKEGG